MLAQFSLEFLQRLGVADLPASELRQAGLLSELIIQHRKLFALHTLDLRGESNRTPAQVALRVVVRVGDAELALFPHADAAQRLAEGGQGGVSAEGDAHII